MSRDLSIVELTGAVLSWLVGRWEGERGGRWEGERGGWWEGERGGRWKGERGGEREGEGGCSVEQSLVGLQVVVLGGDMS